MATTEVEVVSPDRTLYSGEAEMVVCRTVDGEIAFLANHTPLIGALEPCVVRIVAENDGGEVAFAVAGGFVEVSDNQVILLADRAERPEDVDVAGARADLSDAEARLRTDEADEVAKLDERYAQARLDAAGASPTA
jgi:F-type H+-transporting ATPase subunit epsilon